MFLPLRAWRETVATFLRERKRQGAKHSKPRALRLEQLEPRQMMAVLYWDPSHSGGASLGGSGSWNTTCANWWDGSSDVAWNNSNGDTAVFSGTAGTATLSSGIQAGEVDFTTDGYLLQSGGLAIGGSGVVDVAAGLTDTISTSLNGSSGLTLTDTGTLLLSGSNTFTGDTTITYGTLQLGSSAAISDDTAIGGGGILDLNGQSIDDAVRLDNFSGTLINSSSTAASFAGTVNYSASHDVAVAGSGDITLSGQVNFASSTLTMDGSGTLTLSGYEGYGGPVSIESGMLQLASATALGHWGDATISGSGILDLDGQNFESTIALDGFSGTITNSSSTAASFAGTINADNQASFTVTGSGDITISGDITGSYGTTLTVDGSNTVVLSGNNSIENVDLESGTLQLTGADALSGDVSITGTSGSGILDFDGQDFTSNLSTTFNGTLTNNGGTTIDVGGTVQGDVTVTGNIVVGTTDLDGGTLHLGSYSTVTDDSVFSGTGTLDLNGQSLDSTITLDGFSGTLTNSNSAAGFYGTINASTSENFTVAGSGNITVYGSIEGSGTLTKTGTGTLTLTAQDTFSGGTTVSGGTLEVDNYIMASAVTVDAGATLQGDGGTGLVTVEAGGNYVADLYQVTIGDGTLAAALNNYAASGSLSLAADGYAWGFNANDALFHALSGSATVDNTDADEDVTYDVQGWGNVVDGAVTAPAFEYESDFSYSTGSDWWDVPADVGPALVLNDQTGFATGSFDSDYFAVSISAAITPETGTISEIPGQISLIGEAAGASDGNSAAALTNGGTIAASGTVALAAASLASDDVGGLAFGDDLVWTNSPNAATAGGIFGRGVANVDLPQLTEVNGRTLELTDGADTRWFTLQADGSYTEQFDYHDSLSYDPDSGLFTFTDSTGDVLTLHDFSGSLAATERGQFASFTTPGGTDAEATYTSGQLSSVAIAATVGGVTTTDTYAYTNPSGLVTKVTLDRQVGSGSAFEVQEADYSYDGSGDLTADLIKDASGNTLDSTHFYYYSGTSNVEYVLSNASYERMGSDTGNVNLYADDTLSYSSGRVSELIAHADDANVAGDAFGDMTYSYSTDTDGGYTAGYNNWTTKTVEDLPNGTVDTYYSNFAGEILLVDQRVTTYVDDSPTYQDWVTAYHYDSAGELVSVANPSAINQSSGPGYSDSAADLDISLKSSSGLIDDISYYSSTTATSSSAGGVAGYVENTAVQEGSSGTPVLQSTTTYYQVSASGVTIDPIAASTVYSTTTATGPSSSGAETTSFAYTFYSSSVAVKQLTTTLPAVTDQNSGGTSVNDVLKSYFNQFGQDVWDADADGNISYTAYDAATGAVTQFVQDVSSSEATSLGGLPSGWSVASGSHLDLTSSAVVDTLGRTTMYTDPDGNITFTVYDDPDHEVRVYQGWTADGYGGYVQMTSPPPTLIYREDSSGAYSETLTMSATPDVDGTTGAPTGAEAISNLQSLSRSFYNNKGQVDEEDDYYDVTTNQSTTDAWAYSTTAQIGTAYDASDPTTAANYLATTYGYDSSGNLDHEADSSGTITDSTYDGLNRLTGQSFGTSDSGDTDDMTALYVYQYDNGSVGDSNLTQEIAYPGKTANDETADARVSQFAYDWRDRLVAEKDGVTLDDGAVDSTSLAAEASDTTTQRPITYYVLDNLGDVTEEDVYSGNGYSLSDVSASGISGHPFGDTLLRSQISYSYDALGREYSTTVYSVNQTSGSVGLSPHVTSVLFDGDGDATASTDARGYTTNYDYDNAGRETEEIDPSVSMLASGSTSATTENPTTYFAYDADGNETSVTDPNGKETDFEYDAAGRLTEISQPEVANPADDDAMEHPTTTFSYNAAGYLGSETDAMDRTTSFSHDALGRETGVTQPGGSGVLTDTNTYYPDGNLESVTDPYGNTTSYTYNNLGETITSTNALGVVTGYFYDVLGQQIQTTQTAPEGSPLTTSETTYDALGGVLTQTDAMSNTTGYAYNGFHELAIQTDPDEGTTDYSYDADGDLTSLTDPDDNTTTYSYNALDEETGTSETVALSIYHTGDTVPTGDSVDSDGNLVTTATTSYQYDANGNITRSTDADGHVISDQYDALNRNTAEQWYSDTTDANSETGATNSETFSYDLDSSILAAGDDSSSYTYSYYSTTGQLETIDNNGVNSAVEGGVPDVVLTYGYNEAGQVSSEDATINGHDDFQNAYSYYSDTHLLETITQSGSDADGADAVADKRVDFTYTSAGEVYTEERYTGLEALTADLVVGTQYSYDALGRLTGLEHGTEGGTTIYEDYTWTYNADNRVHTVSNSSHSGDDATYTYDGDSQLSGSYDANGNPDGSGYVVGAGNRVLSDGVNDYTYDAAGNLILEKNISSGDSVEYDYDNRDQLTSVTEKVSDGTITQVVGYTYDVNGGLIGRSITPYTDGVAGTTSTQTFVVDPLSGNVALAFDGSGNLTERVLSAPAVDQILAVEDVTSLTSAGSVDWLLPNNEGTDVDVVGSDGTLEDHLTYSSFGELTDQSGPATYRADDVIFGAYTGSFYDSATGLVHDGLRWYKPAIQQWLTTDPIGLLSGETNFRRYAGNDPVNEIDPSGLWFMAGTHAAGAAQLAQNQAWLSDVWAGVSAFPGAVASTFSSGQAWDSLQGAATQYADDLASTLWDAGMSAANGGVPGFGAPIVPNAQAPAPPQLPNWLRPSNWLPGPLYGHQKEFDEGKPIGSWTFKAQEIAAAVWGACDTVSDFFGGGDTVGGGYGGPVEDEGGNPGESPAEPGQNQLNHCFPAGTLVAAVRGVVPIEVIERGEDVWAYDLVASRWRACRVLNTYKREYEGHSALITIAGESIEATFFHPFWVVSGIDLDSRPRRYHWSMAPENATTGGRWVDAADVRVGDTLLLRDGRICPVQAVRHQPYFDTVYNFRVAELECFAVGRNNVLVHNQNGDEAAASPTPRKPSAQIRAEWEDANGQPWPKDPDTGVNQDVSHKQALADGGTNDLTNVEPKPHADHVQQHVDNGDFKRWGARRAKNQ